MPNARRPAVAGWAGSGDPRPALSMAGAGRPAVVGWAGSGDPRPALALPEPCRQSSAAMTVGSAPRGFSQLMMKLRSLGVGAVHQEGPNVFGSPKSD